MNRLMTVKEFERELCKSLRVYTKDMAPEDLEAFLEVLQRLFGGFPE